MTPEAEQVFKAWKDQERVRRAAEKFKGELSSAQRPSSEFEATPPAPLGTVSKSPEEIRDEADIQSLVRDEEYPGSVIDTRSLPADIAETKSSKPRRYNFHGSGLPASIYRQQKKLAESLPLTADAQDNEEFARRGIVSPDAATLGTGFDGPSNGTSVPPDTINAVGPNHVIGVVNSKYRIYTKAGAAATGEITLATLFSGVANCSGGSGLFDPFIDYDEANDRYVMGAEILQNTGLDAYLCVAATQTGDPTGSWNRFSFRADANATTTWLDYPHMAIGYDHIYISANMFNDTGNAFNHIRLFALDKPDLYNNTPLSVAEATLGSSYFAAAPEKLNGATWGGYPSANGHYFLAQHFNGGVRSNSNRLYKWTNPFAPSVPTIEATFTATWNGFPPSAPDNGTNPNDTGDTRWLDLETLVSGGNRLLLATRGVGCNIGGGAAEACIDWIIYNATTKAIVDQQSGGAYGASGQFLYHPDAAWDRNGDVAITYTKSNTTTAAGVWQTGRLVSDAASTLQADVLDRAGAGTYDDGAGCGDGSCDRWGDYAGMSLDPNGCTFWAFTEWSRGGASAWDTRHRASAFSTCSVANSINFDKSTYDCSDVLRVTVTDTTRMSAAYVAAQVALSTSGGDAETIPALSWDGTNCIGTNCGTWTATIPVSGTGSGSGNGTLNVANGGSITGLYTDTHGGGHTNQSRSAGVSCQTQFADGGYFIDGGCEDGTGTELYRTYLDGNEYLSYTFGIYNPQAAPNLNDVRVTLSVTGAAASKISIQNPTVNLGPVAQGTLIAPVFMIYVDPTIDTAALRATVNTFQASITSPADGYTTPQLVTQNQIVQADDNIVANEACFDFESGVQGFVQARYQYSYQYGTPVPTTVNTVAAPWTRGTGCLSETRTDDPDMSCDTGGTQAFKSNTGAATCGNFPQSTTTIVDDVVYSPRFAPANTGIATNINGVDMYWNYNWLYSDWYYNAQAQVGPDYTAAQGVWWSENYTGVDTPATNDIDNFDYRYGYYLYDNQAWDSATPYNPPTTFPANYDGTGFSTAYGIATAGLMWRMAFELYDNDFGDDPTITAASPGFAFDNFHLEYDQYHTIAQTGTCASSVGVAAFDQFGYQDCFSGTAGITVADGNAASASVTVTSDGTGDSEVVLLSGSAPFFVSSITYSTQDGNGANDGLLFVTPNDVIRLTYSDSNPVGTSTDSAYIFCSSGDVTVDGRAAHSDNGDGDSWADAGETVNFTIRIRNNMLTALTNAYARIETSSTNVRCVIKDTAGFGTIAGNGGTATNVLLSDPFTVQIDPSVTCSNPANPPTATFTVYIWGDDFDGPDAPQALTLSLELDDVGGTVTKTYNFDGSEPTGWNHQLGPGDADGNASDPNDIVCSPYVDRFFWSATGGNTNGAYLCWINPADVFPNGTLGDLSDSVVYSPTFKIGATSTTLTFSHEYKFASTAALRADGARVDYSVNGGTWQKMTTLPYDGALIYNSYCNPLCNFVGVIPCLSENAATPNGENIFGLLSSGTQAWVNDSGAISGLTSGDTIRFRWRVGSMNSSEYGLSTVGGYGLDNFQLTNVVNQVCDVFNGSSLTNNCGLAFESASTAQTCGDGDALMEPGEKWDVTVTLRNRDKTSSTASAGSLTLNAGSTAAASITGNPGSFGAAGTIAAGSTGTATFNVAVGSGVVCPKDLILDVTSISNSGGSYASKIPAVSYPVGYVNETKTAVANPISIPGGQTLDTKFGSSGFTLAPTVASATVAYSQSGTYPGTTVYSDNFDSATGWTATAGTFSASTATATTVTCGGARTTANNGLLSGATTVEKTFTITGYTNLGLTVSHWGATALDAPGERLFGSYQKDGGLVTQMFASTDGGDGIWACYTAPGGTFGTGNSLKIIFQCANNGGANEDCRIDDFALTGTPPNWTGSGKVELIAPDGAALAPPLKDFGVAEASPYTVTSFYNTKGIGTYKLRVTESSGTATVAISNAQMTVQYQDCDVSVCGVAPPAAPPVGGDGVLFTKGAGTTINYSDLMDDPCSADHAVVLWGAITGVAADYSGYDGGDTGCNIGTAATGSFTISQASAWFNVIWVNSANAGGHPGFAVPPSGSPRSWTATGFCGVLSDDQTDTVCN